MIPIGPGPSLAPFAFAFFGAWCAMGCLLVAWWFLVRRLENRGAWCHVILLLWAITMPAWIPVWVAVSEVLFHRVEYPLDIWAKAGVPGFIGSLIVWIAARALRPVLYAFAATVLAILTAYLFPSDFAAFATPLVWAAVTAGGVLDEVRRTPVRVSTSCKKCGYDLVGNVTGICPECGSCFFDVGSGGVSPTPRLTETAAHEVRS